MHTAFSPDITLFFLVEWSIRVIAILTIPRNRKPSAAMGWLMLIMLEPILGLLIFGLIGSPKLSKRRREMQRTMDKVIDTAVQEAMTDPKLRQFVEFDVPQRFQPFVALNTELGGMPAFSGNLVSLLPEYDESIAALAADVRKAQDFAHLEFFITTYDEATEDLFQAMAEAVERGVKVRVLLDAFGSWKFPNHRTTKRKLTEIGVEWHLMLPLRLSLKEFNRFDLRNHRKLAVFDGKVGYTGSQNLITRNYHRKDDLYYDELMVRLEGPIVVQLHGAFVTDWYSESGELITRKANPEIKLDFMEAGSSLAQVLPSGPGYDTENNLKLFTGLIHAAQREITIVNPYFVPDDSLLLAITSAAQRGVKVTMVNSEIMDQKMVGHAQRSYYEELLKAGVQIHLYKYPALLHSKFMTIDDDMAVIGSSNLDLRSFQLDLEVSLVVYDMTVVDDLQKLEQRYLGHCVPVKKSDWQARPLRSRLLDNLARLTASLQ